MFVYLNKSIKNISLFNTIISKELFVTKKVQSLFEEKKQFNLLTIILSLLYIKKFVTKYKRVKYFEVSND